MTRRRCLTAGDEPNEYERAIIAAAVAKMEAQCKAESDIPMPALAQRIHGRANYRCGRDGGHEGPHRWPEDGSRAEWPQ